MFDDRRGSPFGDPRLPIPPWKFWGSVPGTSPGYPVYGLLSWSAEGKRLQILVGTKGNAAALERFAEQSLALLQRTFPECQHALVLWAEADERGLERLAEEASRRLFPGEQLPYDLLYLTLR